MNVRLEDETMNKKLRILYIVIISICVIALISAVCIQIFGKDKETKLPELTDSDISQYKSDFNKIFNNKANYLENNRYTVDKVEEDKEIIYTGYKSKDSKLNDYDLDVNIPYININDKTIDGYNKSIKDIFEKKTKEILNSQNNSTIYSVNYSAYVQNNILSLVIRSTLKEGTNPQRDIIQTYNYNLETKKECSMEELLNLRGISKQEANKNIKTEIKRIQERVEELNNLGYNVYPRNYDSDIYSINNVTEFFMGEKNIIYVIYAYGNNNFTSEMDVVVM